MIHVEQLLASNLSFMLCNSGVVNSTLVLPHGYKKFFIFNQLSMKFIMLINVKMPTIVGILTFISMINTTSGSLKAHDISTKSLTGSFASLQTYGSAVAQW